MRVTAFVLAVLIFPPAIGNTQEWTAALDLTFPLQDVDTEDYEETSKRTCLDGGHYIVLLVSSPHPSNFNQREWERKRLERIMNGPLPLTLAAPYWSAASVRFEEDTFEEWLRESRPQYFTPKAQADRMMEQRAPNTKILTGLHVPSSGCVTVSVINGSVALLRIRDVGVSAPIRD